MSDETPTPPADESAPPAPEPTAPPEPDAPKESNPLEKALETERAERKKLEAELKKRQSADEKARLAAMDDNARAVEEAKAAARAEVISEYESKLTKARVQAMASSFHDPALVAGLIDVEPDASDDEIQKALDEIGKDKPYLVKTPSSAPPMPQGPRNGEDLDAGDWLRASVRGRR
jgi:hypothetical protein